MYLFSRSILEVDSLNLCIYLQILKNTWSTLSKFMDFLCKHGSILEVDFLNKLFLFKLRSTLEVYFISKKVKKYK